MAIKKVKLPNNTTEDINDPRLPAVTTTDNGKVLSVSGGIWSADSKPSYTLDEVSDGSTRKLADYLPLSGGGTIYGNSGYLLTINRTANSPSLVAFQQQGTLKGFLGINTSGNPVYLNSSATSYDIYCAANSNKSTVDWACKKLTSTAGTNGLAGQFESTRSTVWIANDQKPLATASTSMNDTYCHILCTSGAVDGSGSQMFKVTTAGNVTAYGTFTPGSDTRIKKDQKEISSEEGIRVLEALKPKTWTFDMPSDDDSSPRPGAGLIAQEVKEVIPNAVTISEMGGFKDFHSLNYNTVQGYEIAAIKGLIEEVKLLKAEIAELKKQIK